MTGALTIQQVSQRTGFSEPTLRYYEKIGLLGTVDRDARSGHRRYHVDTISRIEALACLRSSGMSVDGMRRYVTLLDNGDAAGELHALFADQAERLARDIDRLQARHDYLRLKARMWQARLDGDITSEKETVESIEEVLGRF